MYTKRESHYDWDAMEMVTIHDPDGVEIACVLSTEADLLLIHLNRE